MTTHSNKVDDAMESYWRNRDPAREAAIQAGECIPEERNWNSIEPEPPRKLNDASPGEWDSAFSKVMNTQVGGNHYKDLPIQPIEFITANAVPFLEACVIKRMMRHRFKNGVEDLDKAIHEIELIKELTYDY